MLVLKDLWPSAVVGVGLGFGGGHFLFSLGQALAIAIEPDGDGQGKDFGGRPKRMDDEQTKDDPIVSPTDQRLATRSATLAFRSLHRTDETVRPTAGRLDRTEHPCQQPEVLAPRQTDEIALRHFVLVGKLVGLPTAPEDFDLRQVVERQVERQGFARRQ